MEVNLFLRFWMFDKKSQLPKLRTCYGRATDVFQTCFGCVTDVLLIVFNTFCDRFILVVVVVVVIVGRIR